MARGGWWMGPPAVRTAMSGRPTPSGRLLVTPTRVRVVAWTIILAAAALRAYRTRFEMTPDGVAYLDLSDAIVRGHWSGVVNAYWSPLYPVLIGIARRVVPTSPQWEFAAVHALNVLLYVVMTVAFEW